MPSTCTTQAPHWLVSQPTCVPVRPSFSRSSFDQQGARLDLDRCCACRSPSGLPEASPSLPYPFVTAGRSVGIGTRTGQAAAGAARSGWARHRACPGRGGCVLLPFVSLPPRLPHERFAAIIDLLCRSVAARIAGGALAGPLIVLIWGRLRRMGTRFAAIAPPGVVLEYTVQAAIPPSPDVVRQADNIRRGQRSRNVPLILNVLCLDDYIPAGRYIIDTRPEPLSAGRHRA